MYTQTSSKPCRYMIPAYGRRPNWLLWPAQQFHFLYLPSTVSNCNSLVIRTTFVSLLTSPTYSPENVLLALDDGAATSSGGGTSTSTGCLWGSSLAHSRIQCASDAPTAGALESSAISTVKACDARGQLPAAGVGFKAGGPGAGPHGLLLQLVAKVADFGLSTRLAEGVTHASQCFNGTPAYTAAEVRSESVVIGWMGFVRLDFVVGVGDS